MSDVKPCVHGDLCRGYLKRFGNVNSNVFQPRIPCIYSQTCPSNCEFYEPIKDEIDGKEEWADQFTPSFYMFLKKLGYNGTLNSLRPKSS